MAAALAIIAALASGTQPSGWEEYAWPVVDRGGNESEGEPPVRVVIVEPSGHARLEDVDLQLGYLQEAVGGYIEAISGPGWAAYLNEEGKLHGLPANPVAEYIARQHGWHGHPSDRLVGPVVFCGPPDGSGLETSVPDWLIGETSAELPDGQTAFDPRTVTTWLRPVV